MDYSLLLFLVSKIFLRVLVPNIVLSFLCNKYTKKK